MVQGLSDIFQAKIRYKLCVHVCLSIKTKNMIMLPGLEAFTVLMFSGL